MTAKKTTKRKPARKSATRKTTRRKVSSATMEVRRAKNPKPRGTHPYAVVQTSAKSAGDEVCICSSKSVAMQLAAVLTSHARKGVFYSVFTVH